MTDTEIKVREAAMAAVYAFKTALGIHNNVGEDIAIDAITDAMDNLEKALKETGVNQQ